MPLDAIVVPEEKSKNQAKKFNFPYFLNNPHIVFCLLVVEHGQTSLVIELLEPLHGQTAGVLDVHQGPGLLALVVVWLSLAGLPGPAPEGQPAGHVGGRDLLVAIGPEPAVDVDRLQPGRVTALVLEIALPSRGVD